MSIDRRIDRESISETGSVDIIIRALILNAVDHCDDLFQIAQSRVAVCPAEYVDLLTGIDRDGIRCGISVKPKTPVETVYKYLDRVDMVLDMTVEPGFGGQGFIPETAEKVRTLRKHITENGLDTDIEVDGGINAKTISVVRDAGANVIVSGSYLFNAASMADAVRSLK